MSLSHRSLCIRVVADTLFIIPAQTTSLKTKHMSHSYSSLSRRRTIPLSMNLSRRPSRRLLDYQINILLGRGSTKSFHCCLRNTVKCVCHQLCKTTKCSWSCSSNRTRSGYSWPGKSKIKEKPGPNVWAFHRPASISNPGPTTAAVGVAA